MAAQACPLTSGRLCLQASASNTEHLKLFTTYGTLIKLLLILEQGSFRFIYGRQGNCLVRMNFICRGLPPLPPPPYLPHTFKQRLPTSPIVSSRSLHNRNLEPSTHRHLLRSCVLSPFLGGQGGGEGITLAPGLLRVLPTASEGQRAVKGLSDLFSALSGPGLSGVATLWDKWSC